MCSADDFLRVWKRGQYAHTKLANVLFAFEAQRRYARLGVRSCAVDPGWDLMTISGCLSQGQMTPMSYVAPSAYMAPRKWFSPRARVARPGPAAFFATGAVKSDLWRKQAVSSLRSGPLTWLINALYAPPHDGCAAVVHAATVPWEQDRQLAAQTGV